MKQTWKTEEKKDQALTAVKTGLIVLTTGQLHDRTNTYKRIAHSKCLKFK
jgi:hypothetical protein